MGVTTADRHRIPLERAILAANPNIKGVYGVNDSMALGAVDVAKQKGLNLVIFGNDRCLDHA